MLSDRRALLFQLLSELGNPITGGGIATDRERWAWRPYSGYSQHFDHIHLSVSDDPAQYDRTDPWGAFVPSHATHNPTPIPKGETDMTTEEHTLLFEIRKIVATTDDRVNKLKQEFDEYVKAHP